MSSVHSGPERYVFGAEHSGDQHRLLAAAHDPLTVQRLVETGVGDGWRCLEIGAGGGTVARWLAERVAPSGTVLATDLRPRVFDPHPCLQSVQHDVTRDPLPEGEFDLVLARLVLRHSPERRQVLARLVRALRPGGRLQVDEFDTTYEPLLLAPDERGALLYEKFLATKDSVMRAAGVDPAWGRRVPGELHAAGLVDIDVRPHLSSRHPGAAELQLLANHTKQLRDELVSAGMTDAELAELRELLLDPEFRASSSVMYSVQGRKPRQVPA